MRYVENIIFITPSFDLAKSIEKNIDQPSEIKVDKLYRSDSNVALMHFAVYPVYLRLIGEDQNDLTAAFLGIIKDCDAELKRFGL